MMDAAAADKDDYVTLKGRTYDYTKRVNLMLRKVQ